jgi:hypothetical protein
MKDSQAPSARQQLQDFATDMCRLFARWFVMVEMQKIKRRFPDPEQRWEETEEALRRFGQGDGTR